MGSKRRKGRTTILLCSLEKPGFLAAESGAEYFILTIIIKVRDRAKTFTLCRL